MMGGLGKEEDRYNVVNLSTAGDHAAIAATTNQMVFIAPARCEILGFYLAVTTAITAHTSNHWTIAFTNQTGDVAMLSTNFSTDSDLTGNGGRGLTADTDNDLTINSTGTKYLQNAVLEKGDCVVVTLTKAASASNLTYPTLLVKWRM